MTQGCANTHRFKEEQGHPLPPYGTHGMKRVQAIILKRKKKHRVLFRIYLEVSLQA